MPTKINCKQNDQGCWCKDKRIKRSLFGLGKRMCRVSEGKECRYQDKPRKPRDLSSITSQDEAERPYNEIFAQKLLSLEDVRDLGHLDDIIWASMTKEARAEATRRHCEYCNAKEDTASGAVPDKPSPPPPPPKTKYCPSCGSSEILNIATGHEGLAYVPFCVACNWSGSGNDLLDAPPKAVPKMPENDQHIRGNGYEQPHGVIKMGCDDEPSIYGEGPIIFKATSKKTGEVELIADLYWFEENGVHGMDGKGSYDEYEMEFLHEPNQFETACREWLKGCSCADKDKPEGCKLCTDAFLDRIKNLGGKA